jgi:hypothetical protein
MPDIPLALSRALVDRYHLEHELGAGGLARVYLATDVKHHRKVALKVLRPALAAVIGAERFPKEIETTANLQRPHILPLFEPGQVNGTVFYGMPFVEGESLRDLLRRERQLPVGDAVRITREVASALDYARRHGVIPINGSAPERPVVVGPWDKHGYSISPTGELVACVEANPRGDRIMLAPLDGTAAPRPCGDGLTAADHPALSPDGRWIAYTEPEEERPEVYVRAVGGSSGRRQLSVNGGQEPLWTRGGREAVYRRGDVMLAAPFNPATGELGAAVVLLTGRYVAWERKCRHYDVTPDGSRFLMIRPLERPGTQPVVVALNWFPELARMAGR